MPTSLCPLLILVPSDALRRRLKVLLSRERSLSFLNLQLLTFYQLSAKLCAEAEGLSPPILREELFLEEALRQIIRTRQPGTEPFSGIEERAGGCAALWQSLRDLRDGMVQPTVAAGSAARRSLRFENTGKDSQSLEPASDVFLVSVTSATSEITPPSTSSPSHRHRHRFSWGNSRRIFYYGFYDLTQIQVDLFHAVAQTYPTTLFFPLLNTQPVHEGWQFAARFYSRATYRAGPVPRRQTIW